MSFLKDGVLNVDTSIDPRIVINAGKGMPVDMIQVQWTGSYPNLCSGEWIIKVNRVHILDAENLDSNGNAAYGSFLTEDFGTYKNYDTWHFGDDYNEIWERYEDGLRFEEWMLSPKFNKLNNLLNKNNFFLSYEELNLLYRKINQYDWRNNACGGCI